MAPTNRHEKSRHKKVVKRGTEKGGNAKGVGDSNDPRREKYGSDEDFRERVKKGNRDNYRRNNPKKKSRLNRGLLLAAMDKEVIGEGIELPTVVPAYNMTEAANALGKTPLAFKRWIKDDMIPPPVLQDTIRGYNQYSEGELQLIANVLFNHESEYTYFLRDHTITIHRMWQAIEAYRKHHI